MSFSFSKDAVEELKSQIDIVDVIGHSVQLKRAGANYKGLCPFHNEKTPSFIVSPQKQIFTCFGGCGAVGQTHEDFGFVHGVPVDVKALERTKFDNLFFLTRKRKNRIDD